MKVPAQRYDFSDADVENILGEIGDLLRSRRFLTLGDHGEELERMFAERHDSSFAAATSSGTSALEAILRALDVAGGEVIVPTNTFAATAFAVLHAGAVPVFADIGEDLTVDPDDVAGRITPRTRAVITVHIGGLVSPGTRRLLDLCRSHGVPLVEDAAHAHGSALDAKPAGTFGVAAAFSFFSTKVITTGEGGMVVTSDPGLDRKVRLLRDQAKEQGQNVHETVGYSWRMTELQAILGKAQLRRLDEFISERQRIAARYDRAMAGIDGLEPIPVPPGAHHNFYKYTVLVKGIDPDVLKKRLKEDFDVSLGGTVYDVPLHRQPAFAKYVAGSFPVADELCPNHICPPIYPSLTDDQVDHVTAALEHVVSAEVAPSSEVGR